MGLIVGQSVLLVADDIAREVGSPPRVLLVWAIGGLIVVLGSFCHRTGRGDALSGRRLRLFEPRSQSCNRFLVRADECHYYQTRDNSGIGAGTVRLAAFFAPSLTNPTVARPLTAMLVAAAMVLNYFVIRTVVRLQIVRTVLVQIYKTARMFRMITDS